MLSEPLWRSQASCRAENAAYFFAPPHFERKQEKDARESVARRLCDGCVVKNECLDYALTVAESHGIWGGMNELERRRLLRRRAVPVAG